jgi:16S rRNA (cytidine1402-2'-O)-methyltransferase
MPGTLFVVATPIGNLEDVTLRALKVLRDAAVVAAEDTRRTGQLLRHYDIRTPLVSFHDHNEHGRAPQLVERLRAGESVALVSDAGTPLISDPGFLLVREAVAAGIPVVSVPGPSWWRGRVAGRPVGLGGMAPVPLGHRAALT